MSAPEFGYLPPASPYEFCIPVITKEAAHYYPVFFNRIFNRLEMLDLTEEEISSIKPADFDSKDIAPASPLLSIIEWHKKPVVIRLGAENQSIYPMLFDEVIYPLNRLLIAEAAGLDQAKQFILLKKCRDWYHKQLGKESGISQFYWLLERKKLDNWADSFGRFPKYLKRYRPYELVEEVSYSTRRLPDIDSLVEQSKLITSDQEEFTGNLKSFNELNRNLKVMEFDVIKKRSPSLIADLAKSSFFERYATGYKQVKRFFKEIKNRNHFIPENLSNIVKETKDESTPWYLIYCCMAAVNKIKDKTIPEKLMKICMGADPTNERINSLYLLKELGKPSLLEFEKILSLSISEKNQKLISHTLKNA